MRFGGVGRHRPRVRSICIFSPAAGILLLLWARWLHLLSSAVRFLLPGVSPSRSSTRPADTCTRTFRVLAVAMRRFPVSSLAFARSLFSLVALPSVFVFSWRGVGLVPIPAHRAVRVWRRRVRLVRSVPVPVHVQTWVLASLQPSFRRGTRHRDGVARPKRPRRASPTRRRRCPPWPWPIVGRTGRTGSTRDHEGGHWMFRIRVQGRVPPPTRLWSRFWWDPEGSVPTHGTRKVERGGSIDRKGTDGQGRKGGLGEGRKGTERRERKGTERERKGG